MIGAAIEVHRQLGPSLDEIAYEEALSHLLLKKGVANRRQVPLPLVYKGIKLACGYRIDLLVEERLPIELKAVDALMRVHDSQLLTYLRIGQFRLGLLINFNVAVLKQGIRRKVETRVWVPPVMEPTAIDPMRALDPLSAAIVTAALDVHRNIGPGLLDSSYLACLCYELSSREISFEKSKKIPLSIDHELLFSQAEIPLVVAEEVPVFPICVDNIGPVHIHTAICRLRQGKWRQGLVLNFNTSRMTDGIRRVIASSNLAK